MFAWNSEKAAPRRLGPRAASLALHGLAAAILWLAPRSLAPPRWRPQAPPLTKVRLAAPARKPPATRVPQRFAAPKPKQAAPRPRILAPAALEAPPVVESAPEPARSAVAPSPPKPGIAAPTRPERPPELKVRTGLFDAARRTEADAKTQAAPAGFGEATLLAAAATPRTAGGAGFGEAATQARRETPADRAAGFGEAKRAEGETRREIQPPAAAETPVRVLWKPEPLYTDEARLARVEGDVLLLVRFPAGGAAEALRLIEGLGHGLDERALAAVKAIRFKAATRNGDPVDSVAQVRIRFALAY